jgi:hypothetical protein
MQAPDYVGFDNRPYCVPCTARVCEPITTGSGVRAPPRDQHTDTMATILQARTEFRELSGKAQHWDPSLVCEAGSETSSAYRSLDLESLPVDASTSAVYHLP